MKHGSEAPWVRVLVAVALLAVFVSPAGGTLLTFDDFPAGGYNGWPYLGGTLRYGLTWSANWGWVDGHSQFNGSGADLGTVSTPIVVYNGWDLDVTVSRPDPFTFNSAYFTSFSQPTLQVRVIGYDGGHQPVGEVTIDVTDRGPTYHLFNWSGVSTLLFHSIPGNTGSAYYDFVMDNFRYNEAVPLPASLLLLFPGLIIIRAVRSFFRS